MHALTLKVSTMKIKRNFLVDLGFCVFKNLILDAIFNCFISIAVIISHVKYSNLDETFKIIKATTVTSWFFILSLGTTGKANCMRVRWRICDLTLIGYVINKSLWFNAVFRADENFKREYLIP